MGGLSDRSGMDGRRILWNRGPSLAGLEEWRSSTSRSELDDEEDAGGGGGGGNGGCCDPDDCGWGILTRWNDD